MGNPFLEETTVRLIEPGRYTASVDPAWNLRPLPQGGIVTAIAARAMADALGNPDQRLRTLHTMFVGQVAHGPVDVAVETLRTGRSMSQLRAEVVNQGSAKGHITTAAFGASRAGFDFTDLRPPDVPRPDECGSFRDPVPDWVEGWEPMPFWTHRVDGRPALGHAPWEDYVPGRAERAMWYRYDDPPFMDDGAIDPLALVVLADTMPGAVGEKVGTQTRRDWFPPSIDLTVHVLDECRSPWVLAHNTARFAGDGYASADMALWDCGLDGAGTPRLVAYATQLFFFSFF
jgi:acyl-CoA thioesterase